MTDGSNNGLAFQASGGTAGNVTIEQLQNELRSDHSTDDGVRLAPDQGAEAILNQVLTQMDSSGFQFDEATVKSELEELLLVLVAHRDQDTHGKGLMGDLATVFDTRLSPGTVYPQLHDLEEAGLLEAQELVRTKEYRIDDTEGMYSRIEAAMLRHQVLGLFFEMALAEFDNT
jgi:DNA-binding transcriptional ArsR family regulator